MKKLIDKSHSGNTLIRTNTVLTDQTYKQLEVFKQLWLNLGADLITFQDLPTIQKIVRVGHLLQLQLMMII